MTALTGQTIASSYEQVLHVDTDGGGNGNNLLAIKDGDNGTTFGLKIATNKVEVIPGSDDANAFEVSTASGTPILTVNSSTSVVTITGDGVVTDDLTLNSDSAVFNMGAGNDFTITHDGTTGATIAGNPLTLDSGADIVLDADGADIIFKDGGTSIGTFTNSSSDFVIASNVNDKDILIKGVDNTAAITAATFDMSDAGSLSLNNNLTLAATKILYLDGGGNSYIHEAAADRVIIVAGGENRVVANATGVGFGKTPSKKIAIGMSTSDLDIEDAGTASASSSGSVNAWIEVRVGTTDGYIKVYDTK